MTQLVVMEKKIQLLQKHRPNDPDLAFSERIYLNLSALAGQAIAATVTWLPQLKNRPAVAL
jgi:hypothetical protein